MSGFLWKSLLAIVFVALSGPTAAHAISHAAHKAGIKLSEKSVVDRYQEDKKKVKES